MCTKTHTHTHTQACKDAASHEFNGQAEDETGYRALLDKEKDKRLSFLLDQTDAHLHNMAKLIRSHQEQEITAVPDGAVVRTYVGRTECNCAFRSGQCLDCSH